MTRQFSKPAYAKIDPAHLFDGLFTPMKGTAREKGKDGILRRPRLLVPVRNFGGLKIGFQGFEQLGADDQSVLLAISAQLGINGMVIANDPSGETSKQLRMKFDFEGDATSDVGAQKTSLRSLLIDAGYNPNKSTDIIKESLNRLRNAQIREENGNGWDRAANLISVVFNKKTGEVYVAANPRLTGAIFSGQHIKISLFERNQLESEVAKILHAWMCSNIRPGHRLGFSGAVHIDHLIPHIWGPHALDAANYVISKKRRQVRDALSEIATATAPLHDGYGWHIEQSSSGMVFIARPKDLPMIEAESSGGYANPSDVDQADREDEERHFWDSGPRQSKWSVFGLKPPSEYKVRKAPRKTQKP